MFITPPWTEFSNLIAALRTEALDGHFLNGHWLCYGDRLYFNSQQCLYQFIFSIITLLYLSNNTYYYLTYLCLCVVSLVNSVMTGQFTGVSLDPRMIALGQGREDKYCWINQYLGSAKLLFYDTILGSLTVFLLATENKPASPRTWTNEVIRRAFINQIL